jgi:uncharacterized protein YbjT (DUF2867 family)
MSSSKVLVLNATGKVGQNVCLALKEAGFDVYGTTRSTKNNLASKGFTPVVCNYTIRADLDRALKESGAKKVFSITDYFKAAKCNGKREIQHGKDAIDAAKAAEVDHFVFCSVCDPESFDKAVKHIKTKIEIEAYLKASGLRHSILRPVCFFENFDDAKNYNPLKKGHLKFLSTASILFCSTYDIGRAAAVMFKSPEEWNGKTLDVASWKGDLKDCAAALEKACVLSLHASISLRCYILYMFTCYAYLRHVRIRYGNLLDIFIYEYTHMKSCYLR